MNSDTAKGSFEWLLCPVCGSKTRIKMRSDTELINFPLFCPKCRKETLIHVEKFKVSYIRVECPTKMTDAEMRQWLAVTENSRFQWTEDKITSLNGRGALYYFGGEDGIYSNDQKNRQGLTEVV